MMELTLSTWQRLTLVGMLRSTRGDLGTIRLAGGLLDILEIPDEMAAEAGIIQTTGPNGLAMLSWADDGPQWVVDITNKAQERHLRDRVRQHKDWPQDRLPEVEDLFQQLGLDV